MEILINMEQMFFYKTSRQMNGKFYHLNSKGIFYSLRLNVCILGARVFGLEVWRKSKMNINFKNEASIGPGSAIGDP